MIDNVMTEFESAGRKDGLQKAGLDHLWEASVYRNIGE